MNRNEIVKFLVETCEARQYEDHFELTWPNSDLTRRQTVLVFIRDTHVIIESPIFPVKQIDADRVLRAAQKESPFGIALGGKYLELYVLRTMLPFDNLNFDILNRTTLLLAKNADRLGKEIRSGKYDFGPCKNCTSEVFRSHNCPVCGFIERKPWSGKVVGPPPRSLTEEEFPT